MPVIPCRTNLFQDTQELYQFLLACQQQSPEQNCSQIISLSQEIEPVDPLVVLQEIACPNQLHFYWENSSKNEAIAAIGSTQSITINDADRFVQAQNFIESCRQKIMQIGDNIEPKSPCFFSGLTFFDNANNVSSPFPAATVFLPNIQVNFHKNSCFLIFNINLNSQSNLTWLAEDIIQKTNLIKWLPQNKKHEFKIIFSQNNSPAIINKYQFKKSVISALKSIHKQQFSKIVLSHVFDLIASQPFNIVESLNNLRKNHRDCYIFSISNGRGNSFIGASPERLISIQNQQLETDALAGSAPRGKNATEDAKLVNQLLSSEKERREHQAVSEFIIQRLCQLGLKPQRAPLQLLQLSNIQHLWTPIYAQLPIHIHPLDIVSQLHPTPAVAGVPTEIACEQIRRYETFDRSLYAAPLGWVDSQGNGEFIVGIRSALIQGNHARLYGGAGIVAGSDPDKEFAEVQLKLQSLLKALV